MAELELDIQRWRMQRRGEPPTVIGEAVLRNYPLRLGVRERTHVEALIREFELLLGGHQTGVTSAAPQQLLDVAEMFTSIFGTLIDEVFQARDDALAAGLDRMDSRVPLVHRTPDYLDHFRLVLEAVDAYCKRGALLTPPRAHELKALSDWTLSELTAQYYGAPPTPWAGPF